MVEFLEQIKKKAEGIEWAFIKRDDQGVAQYTTLTNTTLTGQATNDTHKITIDQPMLIPKVALSATPTTITSLTIKMNGVTLTSGATTVSTTTPQYKYLDNPIQFTFSWVLATTGNITIKIEDAQLVI